MRSTLAAFTATLALLLGLALTPSAHAGQADHPDHPVSAADAAAFRNFQLSDDFLDKFLAVQDEIAADPCKLGMIDLMKDKHENMSLSEAAARWDAKPGVHAMLASHDITARQMLLGVGTLMSAAMQDLAATHPKMAARMHHEGPKVSDANMAFYKAHKAAIREHSRARAKKMMQAHGGKLTLPPCLKNSG